MLTPDFEHGNCPACGVSWQGAAIPEDVRHWYGTSTHFSRVIGMEYGLDVPQEYWYDGISEYVCPDCGARFGRWTGTQLKTGEWETRYGKDT